MMLNKEIKIIIKFIKDNKLITELDDISFNLFNLTDLY